MPTDALDHLCGLVAPPPNPQRHGGDWTSVERDLDCKLPSDYKRLIDVFGQGEFAGSDQVAGLFLASYLQPNHVVDRANAFSLYYQTLKKFVPVPYGVYPDQPGLLGFGTFAGVHQIAWHTSGHPDNWSIVYHTLELGFHELAGVSTLSFVISMLEKTSELHHSGVVWTGSPTAPYTFTPGS